MFLRFLLVLGALLLTQTPDVKKRGWCTPSSFGLTCRASASPHFLINKSGANPVAERVHTPYPINASQYCLWTRTHRETRRVIEAVIHIQERLPHKLSVGCSSPSMLFAEPATFQFAPGARSNAYLIVEHPTYSDPALQECEAFPPPPPHSDPSSYYLVFYSFP